jgi:hypothetical protein
MTSNDLRCPRCSAHVSPGAPWCTLCFADLRVPPVAEVAEVEPEVDPDVDPAVDPAVEPPVVPEQAGQQDGEPVDGGRGKHARSATAYGDAAAYADATSYGVATPRDPAESAALEARADEMLALLAAESPHPMGPLADRLESTSARVVAGLIGLVVLSAAALLVMTVLGHFL